MAAAQDGDTSCDVEQRRPRKSVVELTKDSIEYKDESTCCDNLSEEMFFCPIRCLYPCAEAWCTGPPGTFSKTDQSKGETRAKTIADLKQGHLGDCWLLSPLAVMSESHPSLLDDIVKLDEAQPQHALVTVYRQKKHAQPDDSPWLEIQVRVRRRYRSCQLNCFCRNTTFLASAKEESWIQDFELGVAMALRRQPPSLDVACRPDAGDLKVLQSGVALDSWRLLLGPHLEMEPLWFHSDQAWQKYQSYLAAFGPKRVLATCSTHPCGDRRGRFWDLIRNYLSWNAAVPSHAYGVLHASMVPDNDHPGGELRRWRLINPWGNRDMQGRLKDDTNDGIFNVTDKEFRQHFQGITVVVLKEQYAQTFNPGPELAALIKTEENEAAEEEKSSNLEVVTDQPAPAAGAGSAI